VHLTRYATHFEQGQAFFGQASEPKVWPESQRVFLAIFCLGMPSFGGCRVQVSNQNCKVLSLFLAYKATPGPLLYGSGSPSMHVLVQPVIALDLPGMQTPRMWSKSPC